MPTDLLANPSFLIGIGALAASFAWWPWIELPESLRRKPDAD